MKSVKPRKCKECGSVFTPKYSTVQSTCSIQCSIAYSKTLKANKEAKEWAKEKKERKEALMSRKEWLDIAQKVFNTFIRERDKGKPCYMCQKPINGVIHACHYLSQG